MILSIRHPSWRRLNLVFIILFLVWGFTFAPAVDNDENHRPGSNQLDINNASYEEIAQLPIPADLARRIYERILYRGPFKNIFELRQLEGIDQELFNRLKEWVRVEPFRTLTPTQEKIEQIYYRLDQWSGNEGVNDVFVELWIEKAFEPLNVNTVRYDELINLQNVSPVDAAAIINHRQEVGLIRDARDLRGVPGLSYYGYSNARNFLDYADAKPAAIPLHGHFTLRMDNTPFMAQEGEALGEALQQANLYSTITPDWITGEFNALPNLYYKGRFSLAGRYKLGFSFTRNLNEPTAYYNENSNFKIPQMKFFLGMENVSAGPIDIRKLYIGNYSIAFGQGVIMENTDFFTPRKSGYGFRKRFNGISGDNSRTRQFALQGFAAELAYKKVSAMVFGSFTERDAILNRTISDSSLGLSFNQLIVLNQRYRYAPDDEIRSPDNLNLSWLNAVRELTYGGHVQYDFFTGTQLGLTYYESSYDRYLDPNPLEIVGTNNQGVNEWYNRQVPADVEIKQAYGGPLSLGKNPFWSSGVSFRRVYGFDFQTVINNIAIQGEWGELDKGGKFYKLGDNPKALVLSLYAQYPSLNFLALYRNYDVGYDNPFQRSFSNYRRFKGTLYEDYYYLQSSLYGQLYATAAQPQAEEGFYINTYYQLSRQIITRLEYDNWVRKADHAEQYRLVGIVDYRPVFPVTIQLRQKWQARQEQNNTTLGYFKNLEFRGRLRLRLSNFNDLSLMYVSTRLLVHPRPRVFGDMSVEGEALSGNFVHNFNSNLKLSAMLAYYKGFFWNFEDTQFAVMESTRGALRYWLAVYMRLNHYLSLRLKYTADYHKPVQNIRFDQVRSWVLEQYPSQRHGTDWLRERSDFYYLELTYSF